MNEQSRRNEEERERYYGENYESVLEELKNVRVDYRTIIGKLDEHDKRFDTLGKRVSEVKAASETAHKEIIGRLVNLEDRFDRLEDLIKGQNNE